MNGSPKMRVPQAAKYLGMAVSTLNKYRCYGGGPRFTKAGARVVLYDRDDLEAWLAKNSYLNTSTYSNK